MFDHPDIETYIPPSLDYRPMSGKEHTPSKYRSIIQESKSGKGKPVAKLVEEARSIPDPYYQALALFGISADRRASEDMAKTLIKDSVMISNKEPRSWRRAELLTTMCKKAKNSPPSTHDLIRNEVMENIWNFPKGKGQSDAVIGCASFLGCPYMHGLIKLAAKNSGFEMETCKPLLRQWAKDCLSFPNTSLDDIVKILEAMPASLMKVKLHGYLHIQLARSGNEDMIVLENALAHALKLLEDDRIQGIKYLADQSSNLDELELIATVITELGEPENEASLFSTLAANADKAGHKDLALDWFTTGLDILEDVQDQKTRALARIKLASGIRRLGNQELATKTFEKALEDAEGDEKIIAKVRKAIGTPSEDTIHQESQPFEIISSNVNRHVLGLYDTYEGGLKPAHIRMVARAAPLCVAYDLDLALFGFPEKDLPRLIKKVLNDTNIGKGGKYLKDLQKQGRISLISCSQQIPPTKENWKDIGLPIATTSKPANNKETCLEKVLEEAIASHPKKHICMIMGLGKKGLPQSLLDSVDHHMELTGRNIALETSTAMGIIAQVLGSLGV